MRFHMFRLCSQHKGHVSRKILTYQFASSAVLHLGTTVFALQGGRISLQCQKETGYARIKVILRSVRVTVFPVERKQIIYGPKMYL